MPVIVIFIAALIAAGISYAFRFFDNDSDKIRKLSKYADKRQGEIASFIEGHIKKLSDSTASLETKQMQAAAAVKRLESQINEFETIAKNLKGDTDAVKNIESKINSYDEVLKELVDMTEKVEENLQQVKNESLLVDKLNSRIGNQEKNLLELEKRIPVISSEFAQKNGEQLKLIGNKLLSEYDNHGEKLKDDIKKIEDNAQKALSSFQKEISGVYEEASLKAQKLEDTAFEILEKESQEKTSAFKVSIDEKIAQIQSDFNAKTVEMQNGFSNKASELEELLKTKIEEVSKHIQERSDSISVAAESKTVELDKKYNEIYANLSLKFKQKTSEMEEGLAVKTAEIKQVYDETTNSVTANIKKNLSDFDLKCKTGVDEITAKYDEKINVLSEKYAKQLESTGGKSDSRILELQQKIAAAEEKSKSQIASLSEKYQQAVTSIREKYENALSSVDGKNNQRVLDLEKQYDDSYETVNKKIIDLNSTYEEMISSLKEKLDSVQKVYDEKENSVSNEILLKINSIDTNFSEQISTLRSKMQESMTSYEELAKKAEENIESYNSTIDKKIETVKNQLAETLTTISKNVDESVQNAQETVQHVQEECANALSKANEVEPELNEKISIIDAQIEKFREQSNQKIVELNGTLKESGEKISKLCEKQQTEALLEVEKQLSSYKKDIEYRLSKLEGIGGQVDVLEESLKKAMEQVGNKTQLSFDTFVQGQQEKQEQFATSLGEHNEKLENDIKTLKNKIEELKKTAIGSVTEKLSGFEESFDRDLKTRGDKINDELAAWKNSFDGKITSFTTDYENERRSLESDYNKNLQEKIAFIQSKSDEQAERLKDDIKKSETEISENIVDIKNLINNFASEMQAKVNKVDIASDEALTNAITRSEKNLGDQFEKLKTQMLEELKAFEETAGGKQEISISTIDSALAEFKTWKTKLKTQLDDSNVLFKGEIENLREQTAQKVEDAKNYVENEYQEIFSQSEKKVQNLAELADTSLADFNKKADSISVQIEKVYTDRENQAEEFMKEKLSEAARKIQEFNDKVLEIIEKDRTHQSDLAFRLQNYSSEMQTQMSELKKELDSVRTQISVYEKAEQMKKSLDEKIASLTSDFEKLESFKDIASDLTKEYNHVVSLKNDVDKQVEVFDGQKSKVDTIASRYEKMISLSGQIDEKIRSLNSVFDGLQTMEVQVRDFKDTLSVISERYDRLEQKNIVIDRVLKDVDSSFESLKNLEDRIKTCSRQVESLPLEIKDVQNNVDELLKNSPKITEAAAKLNNLEEILSETENRLESINSARTGVSKIEERLLKMDKDLDGKLKLVHDVVSSDVKKSSETDPNSNKLNYPSPQEREQIKQLARQGWKLPEIARSMNRTQAEIQLILDLPSDF